ncbi:MAG: glycoside hydrolase family 127 protein [Bacteroidetes bacterium]|nr:glycoside hydrolase family 127 protein [Bacteroidota bacterium]
MRTLLMTTLISSALLLISVDLYAQKPIIAKYQRIPFGSIKPSGWLKEQMQKDMAGFVGNLDQLVPELISDPIYAEGRLQKHSRAKDLGNNKEGDAEGDEQYKWWNSETQSNWWDGYIRNTLLLDDPSSRGKVKEHISKVLESQDKDGYLGIYDKETRYNFTSENGELWSKTTLLRGLLAYYEATGNEQVWDAIVKAVDNVMDNYPINKSNPFYAGKEFAGGVAHGLTFTDVLDRLYQLTGDRKYWDYATFLYLNYSRNFSCEKDIQLASIFNPDYKLQGHGAHTYEHLRPLLVAAFATGSDSLKKAVEIYLSRIRNTTTVTGGAIGDEWIAGREADATNTGYEYCSLQELLDSYSSLLQKTGNAEFADEIETIFYNAAQGSRNPDHSCIAYLKTDNSYEMLGTRNGEVEPDRNQTRYKYSPAHQDVAVCCNPNAGRISSYFLQSSWMLEGENTLVATLLAPNILETKIKGVNIKIEDETTYPYDNHCVFRIHLDSPMHLKLKIRKPGWAISVHTKEAYQLVDGYLLIERTFAPDDRVDLEFMTNVEVKENPNHEKSFAYGALVYAKPIAATEKKGRQYAPGFSDYFYSPENNSRYTFTDQGKVTFKNGKITTSLMNKETQKIEKVELVPFGKTILRQVSF